MNIPNKIKRGRGRPRKSNIEPQEEPLVPIKVEEPLVPIKVEVPLVPIKVEVPPVPMDQKVRKTNQWVEHCTEVKNREINVGKSYREILKIAKLDYQK